VEKGAPLECRKLIIAITGASGAIYAQSLLRALAAAPGERIEIHLIASAAGKLVYGLEMGHPIGEDLPGGVHVHDEADFTAPPASGSFRHEGMVVVPCTMGTLGAIASGISQNLIHRAADVCLKERRPLVLVPRETPLNRIHLENMLKAAQAGAIILPAMPGFYHKPQSLAAIADFIAARILDQLSIPHQLIPPWNGMED
jgi:4-hydroxy-3-polyprenylbenzoate decarboxylase